MTIFCREFARAVIGDPRARRALAETALDIRTERDAACGGWARLRWLLRSMAATTRVTVRIVPLELAALLASGWAVRLVAWTAVVCAVIVWRPWSSLAASLRSDALTPSLLATMLPPALAVAIPVAALFAGLWAPARSSSPPAALETLIVAALMLTVVQVTPEANQRFREVFASHARPSLGAAVVALPRGAAEMGLRQLVRASVGDTADPVSPRVSPRAARAQIVTRLGLVAVGGTFALLGAVVSRRGADTARRLARSPWAYAVGVPLTTVLLFAIFRNWGLWVVSFLAVLVAVRAGSRQPPV